MLMYLIIKKPFESKLNLYEMVTYEMFIFIGSVCVWILAEMDSSNAQQDS